MQVGLIGAGNMARALTRGWGDPVLVSDGGSGRAKALAMDAVVAFDLVLAALR